MKAVHPKTIKKAKDNTYPPGTVGHKFSDRLLCISNNEPYWKQRLFWMKVFQEKVNSVKFRKLIESKSHTCLQATCNIAFLTRVKGDDAWRTPDNALSVEKDDYWIDVWNWCSGVCDFSETPHDWNPPSKKKKKKVI
ncbi:hypothetical protein [Candidatus Mycoplasma haematohominis]|uniref:hypothetical protein n=1 Tax=Candidatus Mycoplasma haematohominis TaxID=1494318 RepID=UPI001C0A7447|nr:hypothetical protein [Candidatus Mycoplasma haemohominis]